jgi:hypothetical protein
VLAGDVLVGVVATLDDDEADREAGFDTVDRHRLAVGREREVDVTRNLRRAFAACTWRRVALYELCARITR